MPRFAARYLSCWDGGRPGDSRHLPYHAHFDFAACAGVLLKLARAHFIRQLAKEIKVIRSDFLKIPILKLALAACV